MINIDNLNQIDYLCRTSLKWWSLARIDAAVAAKAYLLISPKHPRNLQLIIENLNARLMHRNDIQVIGITNPAYYIESTVDGMIEIIFETLMLDKNFREWNLTDYELEQGVDVDRPDTQYFDIFEKSDKNFINLGAFKQNIMRDLRADIIDDIFFGSPYNESTSV